MKVRQPYWGLGSVHAGAIILAGSRMSSIRTGHNAVARRHLDVLTCDLASVNVRQSDIKRTIDGIRRHAG